MKLLSAIWMIALAVVISAIAAFFSVDGLAALFSATALGVIIMASALEVGKVTVATYLHATWKNKGSRILKSYMILAVLALMLISGMGIYGYLAKGHLEQSAPLASVELEIAQKDQKITQLKDQVTASNTRLTQLDAAVNSIIGKDATKGLKARRAQAAERTEIKNSIDAANTEMNAISSEIVPLKLKTAAVEAKLGPLKFIAPMIGMKDPEAAVRIVIVLIMFSFDPLAIALIISGFSMLHEALVERRKIEPDVTTVVQDPEPEPEPEVTPEPEVVKPKVIVRRPFPKKTPVEEPTQPGNLLVELEDKITSSAQNEMDEITTVMEDRDMLLSILERKPELLQVMVDAVRESDPQSDNKAWIDETWAPPPTK